MQNVVPKPIPALLTVGQDAVIGAAQVGVAIGLIHNNEAAIQADVGALVTARDAHEAGKVMLNAKRGAVQTQTENARTFLTLMRDILKPTLGNQYSEAWDATGFVGSLAVPGSPEEVQPLLQTAQAYLTANPAVEVAALNITAARAEDLFNTLRDARGAVNVQSMLVGNLQEARDAAALKLRIRLRGLINELTQGIGPLDQRWVAFGLNMPGAAETPDVPVDVHAILISNTAVTVSWDGAPRADYYRLWRRIVGVDAELVAVGNPGETSLTLIGLPANAQVEIAVSAVNSGGESQKSAIVTIATH